MERTNLDRAREAHEYIPELYRKRDKWIYLAHQQDGLSQERIAQALGLRRQSIANVIHREAARRAERVANGEQ